MKNAKIGGQHTLLLLSLFASVSVRVEIYTHAFQRAYSASTLQFKTAEINNGIKWGFASTKQL